MFGQILPDAEILFMAQKMQQGLSFFLQIKMSMSSHLFGKPSLPPAQSSYLDCLGKAPGTYMRSFPT